MIDLHMHSTFSDGSMTPEELIAEASASRLQGVALTDHDSTNGVERFLRAAEKENIPAIGGVEISALFNLGTMHILGYCVNPDHPTLVEHLKWICEGRDTRNKEILHNLMELGFHITWADVQAAAGDDIVGRPHFAQVLIDQGYVKNFKEAFDLYLARGRPAYANRRRLNPEDCIQLILQAGGVPVLAHPYSLGMGPWQLRRVLKDLCAVGLEGIEAYYSRHTPRMQSDYLKLAKAFDLVVTGGSDFHGASKPDIHLGRGFGSLHVPNKVWDNLLERQKDVLRAYR